MAKGRNQHSAQLKAKVALEAVKGQKTTSQLSSEYQIHPTVINRWKKQLLESLPEVFQQGKKSPQTAEETLIGALYQEIGRLKMELDWLKKKAALLD
uniref:Transposase n=4 Tax=Candidatus Kentrum sp. LFY TaxID=2126342 RepID=A0A450V7W1_9GAMM|nr:MAG: transposase [Candidatus Kentron sp. LFY]